MFITCVYNNNKAQRKRSYYLRYIAWNGITLYALRSKISMGTIFTTQTNLAQICEHTVISFHM